MPGTSAWYHFRNEAQAPADAGVDLLSPRQRQLALAGY